MAITWLSSPTNVTPGGKTGWQTTDASSAVPTSATGAIVRVYGWGPSARTMGMRPVGVTDNFSALSVTNRNHTWGFVKLDSSQQFESYKAESSIQYYLYGYCEGETHWFDPPVTKTITADGTFQTVDISGDVQSGDTALAALVYYNAGDENNPAIEFRRNSSAPTGYYEEINAQFWQLVPVEAGTFEAKISGISGDIEILGYVKDTANLTITESDYSLSSSSTWETYTLSTAGTGAFFINEKTADLGAQRYGIRSSSSNDMIINDSDYPSWDDMGFAACPTADGVNTLELYRDGQNDRWIELAVTTDATEDTTAPTFSSASTDLAGDTVTVTFDESLDTANDTSISDWTVNVNSSSVTLNSAAIDTNNTTDVIIELASAVSEGDSITVSYSGTTLRDSAGNQVASFTDNTVTNNVDNTPPSVTSATHTVTGQNTADVGATSDENGTGYMVVLSSGSTAPSGSQVKAGTDGNDSAAVDSGQTSISISGDQTTADFIISSSGLTANTTYDYYVTAEDEAGNLQSTPVNGTFTTEEDVPILTNPTGTATGETTADGSVDTDTGSGTLYWVVTTSSTKPSIAQIQSGQDHNGSSAPASGNQSVSATGTQNVSASGLSAGTTYYFHFQQNAPE